MYSKKVDILSINYRINYESSKKCEFIKILYEKLSIYSRKVDIMNIN